MDCPYRRREKGPRLLDLDPVRVARCVGPLLLGNEPKLLHKVQIVEAIPLLDDLAALNAVSGEPSALYLPASGWAELL